MKSHFDHQIKRDYKTTALSFQTVPNNVFGFNKINSGGTMYNIPNTQTNVSLNNEQNFIQSQTSWNQTSIPSFIDFNICRLYNHTINAIYLKLAILNNASSASKILPLSCVIDKIDISRSNSTPIQTIKWNELYLYSLMGNCNSITNVDSGMRIYSTCTIPANTLQTALIKIPSIFVPGCLLDKFELYNDLKFRVHFKSQSQILYSDSTNTDSTKIALSDCQLMFDLNEIDIEKYNTMMSCTWNDYYCVSPEAYNIYSPNQVGGSNYDLLIDQFNNCCVGFSVYQHQVSNPVKNEDQVVLTGPTKIHLKHQNGQEIMQELTDLDLLVVNSNKLKSNSLWNATTNKIPTSYFWSNSLEKVLNNDHVLDGYYNFNGESQKLSLTLANTTSEIFVVFWKISIVRISKDNIAVINS